MAKVEVGVGFCVQVVTGLQRLSTLFVVAVDVVAL